MPTNAATAGEPTLCFWRTPKCYFGYDPVGHIIVESMHRESQIVSKSNYWTAWHRLEQAHGAVVTPLESIAHDGPFSHFNPDDAPALYEFQVSDSMVGWIRYLMVNPKKASKALIDEAQTIHDALEAYPILSEDDYSERQTEAMENYWKNEPMHDRIQWCIDNDVSIFAARRDYPPPAIEEAWGQEMFA